MVKHTLAFLSFKHFSDYYCYLFKCFCKHHWRNCMEKYKFFIFVLKNLNVHLKIYFIFSVY